MNVEDIIKQLEQDERNKAYTDRGIPPVFQINPAAKILIIGQASGKKVEQTLIPFNDKSGEKLISWLGIDAQTFYSEKIAIMPMDFYYPGKAKTGDKPPRKFIAAEYHPELLKIMDNVRLTLLIGKHSIDYYLKDSKKKNLTETVRNYEEYLPAYFPLVHPSPLNFRWLNKNPWFEAEVIPVLQAKVKEALKA